MRCCDCKFSLQRQDNSWFCGLDLPPYLNDLIEYIEQTQGITVDKTIALFNDSCDLGKKET